MSYLARDRLVIALDYPGYGESDAPTTQSDANIANYADSAYTVLDALSSSSFDLIGYHTRCLVAIEMCVSQPDKINKVVNLGAPIYSDQELSEHRKTFSQISLDKLGTRFKVIWERVMQHAGPGMTLDMAADSMAESLRAGNNYEWGHDAAFDYVPDYKRHLPNLTHPIFVMNVNDDLFENSKGVDSLLRNGFRKDYPQFGSGFLDVFPEQVDKEILDFFDS
jgi:pimeloyl-ACP methyl ester carboxylesterase